MNLKFLPVLGLCLSSLVACNKQPSESESSPVPSQVKLTDEALDQTAIPVKEDFEEQASQQVTEENLDEQVSLLEKQIEADK
jgi:cytochrome oxidase Cu insertion factor (SCO1/SenC/PrrC family)